LVWKRHVLVVANLTATSRELLDALHDRATRGSVAVTLVVPASPLGGGRIAAVKQLDEAVTLLRDLGIEADGVVGDGDPMVAVVESWDPKQYDEIILSTLPASMSKWLRADLPRRVERRTGALVTHVVAQPPKLAPRSAPIPEREKLGVITPFSALAWGGPPTTRGRQP
jgi:hypothetical protein